MGWTMGVVWGVGGGLSGYASLISLSNQATTICRKANGRCRIILLLILVARSKLVLDFVLTLHIIHLVITSTYTNQIPENALWWALQAGSVGVMFAGGMWSCRWRELRPMAFGKGSGSGKGVHEVTRDGYELIANEDRESGRVREGRG